MEIVEQVERLYSEGKMRQPDCAKALNMGASTLRREISRHGTTYLAIINRRRVIEARELLAQGKTDLCIAAELGYREVWSFKRAWERMTGQKWDRGQSWKQG